MLALVRAAIKLVKKVSALTLGMTISIQTKKKTLQFAVTLRYLKMSKLKL